MIVFEFRYLCVQQAGVLSVANKSGFYFAHIHKYVTARYRALSYEAVKMTDSVEKLFNKLLHTVSERLINFRIPVYRVGLFTYPANDRGLVHPPSTA